MSFRRDVVVSEAYECDVCGETSQSTWYWWTVIAPEHANVHDFCSVPCLSNWYLLEVARDARHDA